jgi:hypothetical protein
VPEPADEPGPDPGGRHGGGRGRDYDADYTEFVQANWHRLLRLARLLAGDEHRGEELLQDCLVKLYVLRPRPPGSPDRPTRAARWAGRAQDRGHGCDHG